MLDLHGDQKQNKRTTTFFDFCAAKEGVLLCTDVAARGLDIPAVDWIVQFECGRAPPTPDASSRPAGGGTPAPAPRRRSRPLVLTRWRRRSPPDEPKEYIHRVGRTARAGGKGRALLILQPEELTFLKYLKQAKVRRR